MSKPMTDVIKNTAVWRVWGGNVKRAHLQYPDETRTVCGWIFYGPSEFRLSSSDTPLCENCLKSKKACRGEKAELGGEAMTEPMTDKRVKNLEEYAESDNAAEDKLQIVLAECCQEIRRLRGENEQLMAFCPPEEAAVAVIREEITKLREENEQLKEHVKHLAHERRIFEKESYR